MCQGRGLRTRIPYPLRSATGLIVKYFVKYVKFHTYITIIFTEHRVALHFFSSQYLSLISIFVVFIVISVHYHKHVGSLIF